MVTIFSISRHGDSISRQGNGNYVYVQYLYIVIIWSISRHGNRVTLFSITRHGNRVTICSISSHGNYMFYI